MTNRGWNILTIMVICGLSAWFYSKMDKENHNIMKKLELLESYVSSNGAVHKYDSIAYKINKIEEKTARLDSNIKQIVQHCGLYYKYY